MNFKELLIPFAFVFLATAIFQWFLTPRLEKKDEATTGQRFSAPAVAVTGPMRRDISFLERDEKQFPQHSAEQRVAEHLVPEQRVEVTTEHGNYLLSSYGASIASMTYNHEVNKTVHAIPTIIAPTDDWSQLFLLVALDEQTPFYFKLKDHQETDKNVYVTFEADTPRAAIQKKYSIYKDSYRVDLQLTINPHGDAVQPRIFFNAPQLLSAEKKSAQRAGVIDEQQSITKYYESRHVRELQDNYWTAPTFVGVEDRYFIHALVNDPQHLVQRAFYDIAAEKFQAILEGPVIKKETAWNLSFYFGPKEYASMVAIDPRLEVVLEYGWLGFISRPLFTLMKWINSFIHNFGLTIILLTLLITLVSVPFTMGLTRSSAQARDVQKKMQYIKQRYKDDPEALQREQAELIKKHGITGMMGGGGCIMSLIQLPLFFALNRILSGAIELYKAPFLWLSDLSGPDPFYILPAFVMISMLVSAMQGDNQQRIMGLVMALMFGALSVGFPAGLSLYIAVSVLVRALQAAVQKAYNL